MPTILIIDDNQDLNSMITDHLRGLKYKVFQAYNGKEGLDIVQKEVIDLIVADIEMPIMDGLEFLKEIKIIPHLSFIPIIMFTNIGSEEYQVKTLKFGVDNYIPKPVSIVLLQARIEALLRRTSTETVSKREQYNLLRHLIDTYLKQGFDVFTKLLPDYEDFPPNWNGHPPDLILQRGIALRCYFLESYQSLLSESSISKWQSVEKQYPSALTKVIVRNKESLNLAKKLLKMYNIDIELRLVPHKSKLKSSRQDIRYRID